MNIKEIVNLLTTVNENIISLKEDIKLALDYDFKSELFQNDEINSNVTYDSDNQKIKILITHSDADDITSGSVNEFFINRTGLYIKIRTNTINAEKIQILTDFCKINILGEE